MFPLHALHQLIIALKMGRALVGSAVAVAVISLMISSAVVHCATDPPVQSPINSAAREFLEAHNQARASVGVGPLKWSETLANATGRVVRYQRDKMGCRFAELNDIKFGANQFFGGGSSSGWTPRMAVDKWVGEKKYYNYTSNTCAANEKCGTYTQVVWRNSTELGCSQANCVKEMASLIVCFYNPPGNYVGERPY